MKIALIGNMNNNNFSLMRYLLDLGVKVDLLLFSDDGIGSLEHFSPQNDTWILKKYKKNIKKLGVSSRLVTILGDEFPWNIYFWFKFIFNYFSSKKNVTFFPPPNLKKVKKKLLKYDFVIGSGIAPALFKKLNLKLDIFYPYSQGIELVDTHEVISALRTNNFIKRHIFLKVKNLQIKGIQETKHNLCIDVGITELIFKKINIKPYIMIFPMVYREKKPNVIKVLSDKLVSKISQFDMKFISHTRHEWVNTNFKKKIWDDNYSKHNDWIIKAYSIFKKNNKNIKPVLLLSDYGNDVLQTKILIKSLKLCDDVIWLPKLSRKELLEIILICDVGIGEFYKTPRTMWGGTGLEVISCGRPLINSFNFKKGEFFSLFGHNPPDICEANSIKTLYFWMNKLANSLELKKRVGKNNEIWFRQYAGLGKAKTILKILQKK